MTTLLLRDLDLIIMKGSGGRAVRDLEKVRCIGDCPETGTGTAGASEGGAPGGAAGGPAGGPADRMVDDGVPGRPGGPIIGPDGSIVVDGSADGGLLTRTLQSELGGIVTLERIHSYESDTTQTAQGTEDDLAFCERLPFDAIDVV